MIVTVVFAVLGGFVCGVAAGWHMRTETHRFVPTRRLHRR